MAPETIWDALCNAFSVQTVPEGDWVQISPYGDFPHPKGLQRVDQSTCQVMVNDFNSVASKLANLFRGLPFYIGHPDGPPPICNNWPDKSAYGWIKRLEARSDGFYALVKWNPGGQDIITNSKFMYVSPAWYPKAVGRDGSRSIVQPVVLKSVGFVNDPNIPVAPIANSADFTKQTEELISNAITAGRVCETSRAGWMGLFALDFDNAKIALENYGTSEGARKGWETRKGGAASAKVAAKTIKSARKGVVKSGKKPAPAPTKKEIAGRRNANVAAAAKNIKANGGPKPPPLPKVGTPEREALQRGASAKVAATSYKSSGHTALPQTTAKEDHEAFMQ